MAKLKFLIAAAAVLACSPVFSQDNGQADMADLMRSNGRIYVVVAVVVLILLGLILYIVRLDRKISRLERRKETNNI